MFNFIKEKIKKIYTTFTSKAASLFSRTKIDEELLKELEILLISSDTGVKTTNKIMTELRNSIKLEKITNGEDIKNSLQSQLLEALAVEKDLDLNPQVLLLVGINGSGKTTFAAKIAKKFKDNGKKVLLVAGDTFRAAATHQLNEWSAKIGVEIFIGKENQDPASVIFDACKKFKDENFDHIIIDTAGRLQTKINLMKELEKITKIVERVLPNQKSTTWLTIDSMLGQNSFDQAKIFNEITKIDGIILTKLDGTGKGGIVFAISQELKLPIVYVTFGESLDDIKVFDANEYVKNLLGE